MSQAFNLSQLANKVNTSGQLDALTGLTNTSSLGFPSGTRMSFNQTTAPTGWTKDISIAINDSILRLVTGTVGSGGSADFSTWNTTAITGATTLTIAQIPAHTHTVTAVGSGGIQLSSGGVGSTATSASSRTTSSIGGGGSHTHSLINSIKYNDFIIAQKD